MNKTAAIAIDIHWSQNTDAVVVDGDLREEDLQVRLC